MTKFLQQEAARSVFFFLNGVLVHRRWSRPRISSDCANTSQVPIFTPLVRGGTFRISRALTSFFVYAERFVVLYAQKQTGIFRTIKGRDYLHVFTTAVLRDILSIKMENKSKT